MIGTFLIALIATLSGLVQYPQPTEGTQAESLTSILSPAGRLLLITGFCGGLTTFSSLMLDCVQLLESRSYTALCVYCIGTIAGAVVCFSAGWWCGRKLLILFSLPSPQ
jgi:fluoride ion exporter CrcB/FEX